MSESSSRHLRRGWRFLLPVIAVIAIMFAAVACGGTSINRTSSGTYVNQTAWNEAGCGPSVYEPRPSFQNAVASVVGAQRGVSDLSFDADPNTGVYVFDTTPVWGQTGWWILGGTSVASPSLAGVINLISHSG